MDPCRREVIVVPRCKALVKLGNIVAGTLFLVRFPEAAKLAGKKQDVLLPRWLNEETLFPKTSELRMQSAILIVVSTLNKQFLLSERHWNLVNIGKRWETCFGRKICVIKNCITTATNR